MLCYDFSHFLPTKKDFVMHRHITYYTQSTVCQGGFSNNFLSSSSWAYVGFAKGSQLLLGGGGGGAGFDAFAREGQGHASLIIFIKGCNLYVFNTISPSILFINIHFLYEK